MDHDRLALGRLAHGLELELHRKPDAERVPSTGEHGLDARALREIDLPDRVARALSAPAAEEGNVNPGPREERAVRPEPHVLAALGETARTHAAAREEVLAARAAARAEQARRLVDGVRDREEARLDRDAAAGGGLGHSGFSPPSRRRVDGSSTTLAYHGRPAAVRAVPASGSRSGERVDRRQLHPRQADVGREQHAEQPRVVAVDAARVVIRVEGATPEHRARIGGVAGAREVGEPYDAGSALAPTRRLATRVDPPERGPLASEHAPESAEPRACARLGACHREDAAAVAEEDGPIEPRDLRPELSGVAPIGVWRIGKAEERGGIGVPEERVGRDLEAGRGEEPRRGRAVRARQELDLGLVVALAAVDGRETLPAPPVARAQQDRLTMVLPVRARIPELVAARRPLRPPEQPTLGADRIEGRPTHSVIAGRQHGAARDRIEAAVRERIQEETPPDRCELRVPDVGPRDAELGDLFPARLRPRLRVAAAPHHEPRAWRPHVVGRRGVDEQPGVAPEDHVRVRVVLAVGDEVPALESEPGVHLRAVRPERHPEQQAAEHEGEREEATEHAGSSAHGRSLVKRARPVATRHRAGHAGDPFEENSMAWSESDIPDQSGRVAIVTGANSGIGYETARALAAKGARVVLACRSEEKGRDAERRVRVAAPKADARFEPLDLGSLAPVRGLAERFAAAESRLDRPNE